MKLKPGTMMTANNMAAAPASQRTLPQRNDLDWLLQYTNNQVTENRHDETIDMIEDAQSGGGGLFGKLIGNVVQSLAEPLQQLGIDEQLAQMIASIALSVALGAATGGAGTVAAAQIMGALERVAQGDLGGLADLAQTAAGAAGINIPPEALRVLEQVARGNVDGEGIQQALAGLATNRAHLPPIVGQVLQAFTSPNRISAGVADGYDGMRPQLRDEAVSAHETPEIGTT